MRKETMEFDTTPSGEPCVQVGNPNIHTLARKEYSAIKGQLYRLHGSKLDKVGVQLRWFPHDFGSYPQVVISWLEMDDGNESEGQNIALDIESSWPEQWDEVAKTELGTQYFKEVNGEKVSA
jgi:hypothetical protein